MIDAYEEQIDYYTQRDLFVVDGNLVIYGGTFEAGRQKDQWKSNFSWDKLAECIGNTVSLGISIAEYATGIQGAEAFRDDVKENLEPPTEGNDSDTGEAPGDTSTQKPTGQGGTQNQTVATPASGTDNPSANRAQTIGERTATVMPMPIHLLLLLKQTATQAAIPEVIRRAQAPAQLRLTVRTSPMHRVLQRKINIPRLQKLKRAS